MSQTRRRLRCDRRALRDGQERLETDRAEFAAMRRSFYWIVAIWLVVLVVGSLLPLFAEGSW